MGDTLMSIIVVGFIGSIILLIAYGEIKKRRAMKSAPEKTAYVEVVNKEKERRHNRDNESYNLNLTFKTENGEEKKFEVSKQIFYTTEIGDFGVLSTKDVYFYKFVNEEKRTG